MALGGGTFIAQNKLLPGAYINFVSAAGAGGELSERGVVAMALDLDWGPQKELFTVTQEEFQKDSLRLFGHEYGDPKLRELRDLFRHAKKALLYRLNSTSYAHYGYVDPSIDAKTSDPYVAVCSARYMGSPGNRISFEVSQVVDDPQSKDVRTYMDGQLKDSQRIGRGVELKDNDFIQWGGSFVAKPIIIPLTYLTGGDDVDTNTATETRGNYNAFFGALDTQHFNVLGCLSEDEDVQKVFMSYTRRRRDEDGVKFQTVLYNAYASKDCDYEGVVRLAADAVNPDPMSWYKGGKSTFPKDIPELVYWVAGALAGCPVNESLTNKKYDGDFKDFGYSNINEFDIDHTEKWLRQGVFAFHQVGDEIRVLKDINSLQTLSPDKGEDFKSNQTIRVLDQIAMDTAALFNDRYLGKVPNDHDGRVSFWNDLVKYHQQLQRIRAIENFKAEDVIVEAGEKKNAVTVSEKVTPVNAMEQLYMTVVVE